MTKMSPFQIKNFGKQTGLSQKAFAQAVNTHKELTAPESGEEVSPLTSSKKTQIKTRLLSRSVTKVISGLHIDYLRLTFLVCEI